MDNFFKLLKLTANGVNAHNPAKLFSILFCILMIAGCKEKTDETVKQNGDGGPQTSQLVSITGTVSAPGGKLSTATLGGSSVSLATRAGSSISGVDPVGEGEKCDLIEIDADGATVGSVIATGTTDTTGAYKIDAPKGFTADSKYIIRCGDGLDILDARVASSTVDIDPTTHAASSLVTTAADDLSRISIKELLIILEAILEIAQNVEITNLDAKGLATALLSEAQNNEETSNIVNSISTTGLICGTVLESTNNTPLENIIIVAKDFGNWVTRAKIKTDSNGSYCLNVPVTGETNPAGGTYSGEYILGAINRTKDAKMSASEWWSTGGIAYNQFDAEKITVTDSTQITKDFSLEPGARISGTITATGTSTNLRRVQVLIRDFNTRTAYVSARNKQRSDGTYSYRVNVAPGTYLLVARNKTRQPYASEIYNGPNGAGTNNRYKGTPVVLSVGDDMTIDFELETGYKLNGIITDGGGGSAVTGMRVMIDIGSGGGGASERLRTNKMGRYRIWLTPDIYNVNAYGQRYSGVDLRSSNQTKNFASSTISKISAILKDTTNNPVSQAKVFLFDDSNSTINLELSNSDGTVTVYTYQTGNHALVVRIDTAESFASTVYNGATSLSNRTAIDVTSTNSPISLGDITLPDGGVLTGKVTEDGTIPIPNFRVQVRSGGTQASNVFVQVRTRGDGTYEVTLPAGTYDRVKMRTGLGSKGQCDDVIITAGGTTTLNYNQTDDTCLP